MEVSCPIYRQTVAAAVYLCATCGVSVSGLWSQAPVSGQLIVDSYLHRRCTAGSLTAPTQL